MNKKNRTKVILLTGLSGAGKTTLGRALVEELKKQQITCEHLDGDEVRKIIPQTGFDKESRIQHIKRIAYLASILERNKITVVASFIAPYAESRNYFRELCKDFVEVYVSTPIETCEERDVKGLYVKARSGEIKNFTGIDDPYEVPESPEVEIDTRDCSVEESVEKLMLALRGVEKGKIGF